MAGKRPVSRMPDSSFAAGVVTVDQMQQTFDGTSDKPHAGHAIAADAGALNEPPVWAEIESLKSDLLSYAARERIPDPSEDVVSSAEIGVCNACKGLLNNELYAMFRILDRMTNKKDALEIYRSLERSIHFAVLAGMNNPNSAFLEFRQDMGRSKRKANIAAEERREKMRPFVEDLLQDFLQVHGFNRVANAMYKALMKRSEFRNAIPKGPTSRQIKGDLEAILVAIDTEAELAHAAGFGEGNLP